jgi:hydroxymethylpyrimidine pyrophosphatase-like HAD family hydrolase
MKKNCTIFCDIDGTLFKYRKFETYKTNEPDGITENINMINTAFTKGHHVVLTTARPEYLREHTIMELEMRQVRYHQLVMGIERGTRILINDNELPTTDRAYAINVTRDNCMNNAQKRLFNDIINS